MTVGAPVYGTLRKYTYDVPYGTAFMVKWKDRAYMITNWHVCRSFGRSEEVVNELTNAKSTVSVIAAFPTKDLCILTPVGNDGLEIGKSVPKGYPVYTGGYPTDSRDHIVLRSGRTTSPVDFELDFGAELLCPGEFNYSSFRDPKTGKNYTSCTRKFHLQDTTLLGKPGCSGSPVVNSKGKLVGIVNSTNEGTLSYVFVEELIGILKSLETK